MSLDVLVSIDFEPDGTDDGGIYALQCSVCSLQLSEYDFSIVREHPYISYLANGDESWNTLNDMYPMLLTEI
jgi:hypothetical protein